MGKKKIKQNKDKIARQETENKKFRLIWEGIRRREDYKLLYKKFHDFDKQNDVKSIKYLLEIGKKFGIYEPIDPATKPSKVGDFFLRMYFSKAALTMPMKSMRQANKSKKSIIALEMFVDMTKSKTQICKEFEIFIKSVKGRREKAGLDKNPKPKGRRKLHSYNIGDKEDLSEGDFAIYDKVIKHKKNSRIPFHKIARKELETKGNTKIKSFDVDSEAKKMIGAYNRAKWLIEKGWRIIA